MRNNGILSIAVLAMVLLLKVSECRELTCEPHIAFSCAVKGHGTFEEDEPVKITATDDVKSSIVDVAWEQTQIIKRIPNEIFDTFPNLYQFSLVGSSITKIQRSDFQKSRNLGSVAIEKSPLEDIDDFSFADLNKTESLRLNNNKLTTIRRNTFDGLTSLKFLYLDWNQIETIEDGAFRFPKLLFLHITHNKLKSFTQNAFAVIPPLETIEATDNDLTTVDHLFSDVTTLKKIKLYRNDFNEFNVTATVNLPNLKWLHVDSKVFKIAAEEDVATAEAVGKTLEWLWLGGDEVTDDVLQKIRRVFKEINMVDLPNGGVSDEKIQEVYPEIKISRWNDF